MMHSYFIPVVYIIIKIFVKMTIIQPSHTNNLISYHAY